MKVFIYLSILAIAAVGLTEAAKAVSSSRNGDDFFSEPGEVFLVVLF